jgi:arylsulfatase A-like enzyme/cytochrome c-type biogenesis protein CcmH/NrfG
LRAGKIGILLVLAGFATLSHSCLPPGGERENEPAPGDLSGYNVLLITADTTRADRLGCYGYDRALTPVVDGLAGRGVLFENAYSPAVTTLPAHATILTGLLPPAHGVRANGSYRLREGIDTLPERLREAGFKTGAVVGARVLAAAFGLDRGFGFYDDMISRAEASAREIVVQRDAETVTGKALEWLERQGGERWFLWAHYFDPHAPYRPPQPYGEQSESRPYDGEIAFMDSQIGRLLEGIEDLGGRESTVVVFVGDHGEGLGDHGERAHGVLLYDETTRVPLILAVPGVIEGPRRVAAVVRTTDIMPTLLDLLGMESGRSKLQASLWPLIDGQIDDAGLAAYSESVVPFIRYGWSPMASIRLGDWKYVHAPEAELYDMASDPRETSNLARARPETAGQLRSRLEQILRETVAEGAGSTVIGLSPEEEDQLRSLGYAGGGRTSSTESLEQDPSYIMKAASSGLADPKSRVGMLRRIEMFLKSFRGQEHQVAILRAQAILAEDPGNNEVRQVMGHAYLRVGRLDEALAAFETVVADDGGNLNAWLGTGAALARKGDRERAKAAFRKVISLYPGLSAPLAALGRISLREGDLDGALEHFNTALRHRPNSMEALLGAAATLERQGKTAEAERRYREALRINPSSAQALEGLARLPSSTRSGP